MNLCSSHLPLPAPNLPQVQQRLPEPGAAPCPLGWSEQDFLFPTSLGAAGFLVCFLSEWETHNEKLFKQLVVQGNPVG